MILSFHPLFAGDRQIIVAGREPGERELKAIQSADAVILPQGCGHGLYRMVRDTCPRVFPNYDARFAFPGKLGQIALFRQIGTPHPPTMLFADAAEFTSEWFDNEGMPMSFPFVFKFDWGGEGDTVYLVESSDEMNKRLNQARKAELSGQKGFLCQEYVDSGNETLRVVVLYDRLFSYWRRHPSGFYTTLSRGAVIEENRDPERQKAGRRAVRAFCRKTGTNLAGIDLIFPKKFSEAAPLFLEINYFFGRKGIGGAQLYYDLLMQQILRWIKDMGLTYTPRSTKGKKAGHGSI
jgi:ribosomal protein S6--L-glutamate ligase